MRPDGKPPADKVEERAAELGRLVVIDSDAFRPDGDGASKKLCNVMLALAVVYNDLRDLELWHEETLRCRAGSHENYNRLCGEWGGMLMHSWRLLIGLLHELGVLLRKNSKVLDEPFFVESVLSRLPPDSRHMWERVRELAESQRPQRKETVKRLDRILHAVRNKTAFHYDVKALAKAYAERFPSGARELRRTPFVSLGDTVFARRFFFADAVVQTSLETYAAKAGFPFAPSVSGALKDLAMSLALILQSFIEARRLDPWKPFEEHAWQEEAG
jgi:hypothetical protein